jgi:hypothetical protein
MITKKEVAMYLPYKVMAYDERQENKTDYIVGIYQDRLDFENWSPLDCGQIENYKLCLRPLSDLTKEIEIEGEKIVPIVELAKIAFPNSKYELDGFHVNLGHGYSFYFDYTVNSFNCLKDYNDKTYNGSCFVPRQFELFQKLLEWHFWIGDQSKFGQDIIDINTLK